MHGVLFVPRMGVRKLSVSFLEDDGFGLMVRFGHVFLYQVEALVGTTILLGDHRDRLYVLAI